MAAFVLASVLAALLTMASALSVTDFLQLIFPGEQGVSLSAASNPVMRAVSVVYDLLIAQGAARALVLYAVLLFVLYAFKNLFSYLAAVLFARIKTGVLFDIRNALHRAVLHQDFSRWSSQAQGQWLSRMGNDVAEYETNLLDSIQMLIASSLTMLIYVAMLVYLNWSLTLIVVVVMAVGTLLLSASRRLKRESRLLQSLNGDLMTTTQETLDSLKEIKAATAIDYVNGRQQRQNRHFTDRRIRIYRRIYAASPLSDFVGNVIVAVILIVGAVHTIGSQSAAMPPSLFVSYIMIYVLLLTPIKDFSNAIAQLKKGRGVEERIAEACDGPYGSTAERDIAPDGAIESIELKDLSFSYGGNKVFDRLSLTMPMHCHTALTGASGSGKTTLGRLLAGLLQPQGGQLLVNGLPDTEGWRTSRIAYIPQQPMLFNDTIEANIRFGRPWLTDADIEQAAHLAQLDSVLASHNAGLKTVVGDGGSLLSGGEQQRVSIARALAGNPSVVVMDEATAALDSETEQRLTASLRSSMRGRTLFVIAHRASTIAACDKVINLENLC